MSRSLFLIALLLPLVGCNGKPPVIVHPVSGQVQYAGKPAAGVHVYFCPTSAPMRPDIPSNPHAITGADGNFRLTTFTENDGAAPGGYQVVMIWPIENENEEATIDRLMGWYDTVHSQMSIQVKEGANDLKPFSIPTITRPPEALNGVPGRN
jgi:hypothetical protein